MSHASDALIISMTKTAVPGFKVSFMVHRVGMIGLWGVEGE